MRIIVTVKEIPHPDYFSKINIDPDTGTLRREGVPSILNPPDKYAIEEALRIRERVGGEVYVISMGPLSARSCVEEAMGMGCDGGVLLSHPSFAGSDTIATAYSLSLAIRKLGFDLVITGSHTLDSGTGSLPPQLAEFLKIPHMISVMKVEIEGKSLLITSELEKWNIKMRMPLPCLIAVKEGINEPRIPSVSEIVKLKDKPFYIWGPTDIGADEGKIGIKGSPTKVEGMKEMERRRGKVLSLPPDEAARIIIRELKMRGIV